jgi:hypothetical protein
MGLRFRKRFMLLPLARLNISRGGVSTTIGVRGGSINVSRRGVQSTIGLPGSGLSYTTQVAPPSTAMRWFFTLIALATLLLLVAFVVSWAIKP